MKKPLKIKSDFALLDVLGSGAALQRALAKRGGVPVVIKGRVTAAWGNHDGTSQEYQMLVQSVEVEPAA
jgi:hypothetical protein